jgi:hypothetical protein
VPLVQDLIGHFPSLRGTRSVRCAYGPGPRQLAIGTLAPEGVAIEDGMTAHQTVNSRGPMIFIIKISRPSSTDRTQGLGPVRHQTIPVRSRPSQHWLF